MELTEEVIVKKWAPPIVVAKDSFYIYLSKAALYHQVHDRIIEIANEGDVWFKVDANARARNKHQDYSHIIHYDHGKVTVYPWNGTPVEMRNPYRVDMIASDTANYLVTCVYGSY